MNIDNTMTIEMTIKEGETYTFGNITFVGNTIYNSEELRQKLGINKGDIFDQNILESRLFGSQENTELTFHQTRHISCFCMLQK